LDGDDLICVMLGLVKSLSKIYRRLRADIKSLHETLDLMRGIDSVMSIQLIWNGN
jgi:hypothetical protein